MIPLELVTLISSTVLGGVMSIWSKSMEQRHQTYTYALERAGQNEKSHAKARKVTDPHTKWTRRVIALTTVFAVVLLPKLAALYDPTLSIYYGYTEVVEKGWWIFSSPPMDVTKWQALEGLVITPLDTHLLAAITGLYFGGSLTK